MWQVRTAVVGMQKKIPIGKWGVGGDGELNSSRHTHCIPYLDCNFDNRACNIHGLDIRKNCISVVRPCVLIKLGALKQRRPISTNAPS